VGCTDRGKGEPPAQGRLECIQWRSKGELDHDGGTIGPHPIERQCRIDAGNQDLDELRGSDNSPSSPSMDNVTREPTGAYPSDAVGDVGGQVDMIVAAPRRSSQPVPDVDDRTR